MTPATQLKRQHLMLAIERLLAPHECVKGVVAVGSVASNTARPDSDIDAMVFMSPIDPYIVPAEAMWRPDDDSFHSIFATDAGEEAIPLDFMLRDLEEWQNAEGLWTDAQKAGLAHAWVAYDRDGHVKKLIKEKTAYPPSVRVQKLDIAITVLDQILAEGVPERVWEHLGATNAIDRLVSAGSALVDLVFAVNSAWRPWPERQMAFLLTLPTLPRDYESKFLSTVTGLADEDGYFKRVTALRQLFEDVLDELRREGAYGKNPASEAFMRIHDEPGRSWNLVEWNRRRKYPAKP
ncbi:MAG: nucleotidyltransferase domain-containing protein [Pseudomonadota bacterium]